MTECLHWVTKTIEIPNVAWGDDGEYYSAIYIDHCVKCGKLVEVYAYDDQH